MLTDSRWDNFKATVGCEYARKENDPDQGLNVFNLFISAGKDAVTLDLEKLNGRKKNSNYTAFASMMHVCLRGVFVCVSCIRLRFPLFLIELLHSYESRSRVAVVHFYAIICK